MGRWIGWPALVAIDAASERPSIRPEKLLWALLLQALFSPHRTPTPLAPPAMAAARAIPAAPSASAFTGASRPCSAGSQRWMVCARPAVAIRHGWRFTLPAAAYNSVPIHELLTATDRSYPDATPRHNFRPTAQPKSPNRRPKTVPTAPNPRKKSGLQLILRGVTGRGAAPRYRVAQSAALTGRRTIRIRNLLRGALCVWLRGMVAGYRRSVRTPQAPVGPGTHLAGTCQLVDNIGAPGEIRTPNPQIRSLVLYPIELRAPAARSSRSPRLRQGRPVSPSRLGGASAGCRSTPRRRSIALRSPSARRS
jgi:hypothetical protein